MSRARHCSTCCCEFELGGHLCTHTSCVRPGIRVDRSRLDYDIMSSNPLQLKLPNSENSIKLRHVPAMKLKLTAVVLALARVHSFSPGGSALPSTRARQVRVRSEDDGWGGEMSDELKLQAANNEAIYEKGDGRASPLERIAMARAREEARLQAIEEARKIQGYASEDERPSTVNPDPLSAPPDKFIPVLVGALGTGALGIFAFQSYQQYLTSLSEVSFQMQ